MKSQTCCFTGHRKIPESELKGLKAALSAAIEKKIDEGYLYFGAGGALGFDTLAAQTVIELRKSHPDIKLILVLPCENQAAWWQESDKRIYSDIIAQADKVTVLQKTYTPDCMHKRNRHLVDNSNACICYLTEPTGGTAYTVAYAKANGMEITNLAEQN